MEAALHQKAGAPNGNLTRGNSLMVENDTYFALTAVSTEALLFVTAARSPAAPCLPAVGTTYRVVRPFLAGQGAVDDTSSSLAWPVC